MKRLLTCISVVCLLAACATAPAPFVYTAPAQPEGSSGYTPKPGWATTKFAVAAANPLATDAGLQVLRAGGTAIDAAVAVQIDRKSTRLNSSHRNTSRMPSSA